MVEEHITQLVTVRGLAKQLGLPATWLKLEAEAGRIPSLKAGRRMLFNAQAVKRVLLTRAAVSTAWKGVHDDG